MKYYYILFILILASCTTTQGGFGSTKTINVAKQIVGNWIATDVNSATASINFTATTFSMKSETGYLFTGNYKIVENTNPAKIDFIFEDSELEQAKGIVELTDTKDFKLTFNIQNAEVRPTSFNETETLWLRKNIN